MVAGVIEARGLEGYETWKGVDRRTWLFETKG